MTVIGDRCVCGHLFDVHTRDGSGCVACGCVVPMLYEQLVESLKRGSGRDRTG